MKAEQIRAELEETREWLRTYAIEAERADTDARYKAGRVDACSHALMLLDNMLDESRIWGDQKRIRTLLDVLNG